MSAGSLVMAFRAVQSMPRVCGRSGEIPRDGPENSMYGPPRRLVSTVGDLRFSRALELEAPLKTIELSAVSFRYPVPIAWPWRGEPDP